MTLLPILDSKSVNLNFLQDILFVAWSRIFKQGARPSLSQHCLSAWEVRKSDSQWFIINKEQKFRIIYFLNASNNGSKVTLSSLSFIIIPSWRGRARSEGRLWGLITNNLWPLVSILQTILRNHKWCINQWCACKILTKSVSIRRTDINKLVPCRIKHINKSEAWIWKDLDPALIKQVVDYTCHKTLASLNASIIPDTISCLLLSHCVSISVDSLDKVNI